MNLNQEIRSFSKKPLIMFLGMGVFLAVCAIVLQDGEMRGYASLFMLFLSFGLGILLMIAGIMALALRKLQAGLEMIASAFILATTYLLILFVLGKITGE